MCLAVPGQVVEWSERDPLFASAVVDFGGIRRPVSMACVPEADTGDYVLVHAGIAISRVDADEAAKIFQALEEKRTDVNIAVRTMRDAFTACELIEKTARIYLMALSAGTVNPLPAETIEIEKALYDKLQDGKT